MAAFDAFERAVYASDRSVLITGCSSGIGLDAARTLAARGWRVLATCRQPADCDRLRAEGLESFPLDLADEAGLAAAAAEALARTGGRLDALFNNGAFAIPGAVEDLPRAALRAIFETNLFGQVDLTNRLLPAMRAAGRGRVVMISSVLGLVAAPWRGAYVATKFALEGITDALRLELAGSGIAVVADRARADRHAASAATPSRISSAHIDWQRLAAPRRLRGPADAAALRRRRPPGPLRAAARRGHGRLVAALESRAPAARATSSPRPTHAADLLRRFLPAALRPILAPRSACPPAR